MLSKVEAVLPSDFYDSLALFLPIISILCVINLFLFFKNFGSFAHAAKINIVLYVGVCVTTLGTVVALLVYVIKLLGHDPNDFSRIVAVICCIGVCTTMAFSSVYSQRWRVNSFSLWISLVAVLLTVAITLIIPIQRSTYSFMTMFFAFSLLNFVFLAIAVYFWSPIGTFDRKMLFEHQVAPFVAKKNGWIGTLSYLCSVILLLIFALIHKNKDPSGSPYLGFLSAAIMVAVDITLFFMKTPFVINNPVFFLSLFAVARGILVLCSYNYFFLGHAGILFIIILSVGANVLGMHRKSVVTVMLSILSDVDTRPKALVNFESLSFLNSTLFVGLLLTVLFGVDFVIAIIKPDSFNIPKITMLDTAHEQWVFGVGAILIALTVLLWWQATRDVQETDINPIISSEKSASFMSCVSKKTLTYSVWFGVWLLASTLLGFWMTESSMILFAGLFIFPTVFLATWLLLLVRKSDFNRKKSAEVTSPIIWLSVLITVFVLLNIVMTLIFLSDLSGVQILYCIIPPLYVIANLYTASKYSHHLSTLRIVLLLITFILATLGTVLGFMSSQRVAGGTFLIALFVLYISILRKSIGVSGNMTGAHKTQLMLLYCLLFCGSVATPIVAGYSIIFAITTAVGLIGLSIFAYIIYSYFKSDRYLSKSLKTLLWVCLVIMFAAALSVTFQGTGVFWGLSMVVMLLVAVLVIYSSLNFPFPFVKTYLHCFVSKRIFPINHYDDNMRSAISLNFPVACMFSGVIIAMIWAFIASYWIDPPQFGLGCLFLLGSCFVLLVYHLKSLNSTIVHKYGNITSLNVVKAFRTASTRYSANPPAPTTRNNDEPDNIDQIELIVDVDDVFIADVDYKQAKSVSDLAKVFDRFEKESNFCCEVLYNILINIESVNTDTETDLFAFISSELKGMGMNTSTMMKWSEDIVSVWRDRFEEYKKNRSEDKQFVRLLIDAENQGRTDITDDEFRTQLSVEWVNCKRTIGTLLRDCTEVTQNTKKAPKLRRMVDKMGVPEAPETAEAKEVSYEIQDLYFESQNVLQELSFFKGVYDDPVVMKKFVVLPKGDNSPGAREHAISSCIRTIHKQYSNKVDIVTEMYDDMIELRDEFKMLQKALDQKNRERMMAEMSANKEVKVEL
ncbi:hypothetical protein PCE1_003226 [Barthelona sp. PCE]